MGQRVFVHVGVPKSGTTYLQRTLADARGVLLESGVLYPQTHDDVMFRAALDVRGNRKAWGRKRREVEGVWSRLCAQARRHPGVTVLSSELLGAATQRQVVSALTLLRGLDVHVVLTVRDLARQLTAEWQEGVKHGRRAPFAEFYDRVMLDRPDDDVARRFRASHDVPEVLHRWAADLPARNVHVVVAGPPGTPPHRLWNLFAETWAPHPDAAAVTPDTAGAANPSLGVAQIDLLRRVNTALDGRLVQPAYGRVVKQYFAQQLLASHHSARPQLPRGLYDDLVAPSERWVKEIEKAGYTVHGNLQDLVPVPPAEPSRHPDEVEHDEEIGIASDVIAELLLALDRARATATTLDEKRRSWKKKTKLLKRRLADLTAG